MKKILFSFILFSASLTSWAQAVEDTLTARHPEYLPGLKVGEVAPQFTATDTLGHKISISDFKGKYVILDFWASWCGDCRREIPMLKELYKEVHQKKIKGVPMQWLSMSFDVKEEAWKDLLRKEQFPWPQISNLKTTREDPTFNDYRLHWIPAFLILDPQGKVAGTAITAEGLKKEIYKLL